VDGVEAHDVRVTDFTTQELGGLDALAALRERYAHWLSLDHDAVLDDRDEDPAEIRAIQLVLRLERAEPPSWHAALELAASGCAALCLDPRAAMGGPWHDLVVDYCHGHIRKVARRGRGAQWDASGGVAGITLSDRGTEVRVLVPTRVAALDKRIAKLQVGGTDVPVDGDVSSGVRDETDPDSASPDLLTMWVSDEPPLTAGKLMAQTGHAGMIAAALLAADDERTLHDWASRGCPARVHRIPARDFARLSQVTATPLHAWSEDRWLAVRDAGFTEVAPGTVTVLARAPRRTRRA
jgi:peptidyl-tRNA hydrolase